MALTGKKRSITLRVNKTIAGITAAGYPKIYYGLQRFVSNGREYAAISSTQLSTMTLDAFRDRVSAFEKYVQAQETGLDIAATVTTPSYI